MAKDSHSHKSWSIFGMFFDFFQLLGYALYGGKFFPWCVSQQIMPHQRRFIIIGIIHSSRAVLSCCFL